MPMTETMTKSPISPQIMRSRPSLWLASSPALNMNTARPLRNARSASPATRTSRGLMMSMMRPMMSANVRGSLGMLLELVYGVRDHIGNDPGAQEHRCADSCVKEGIVGFPYLLGVAASHYILKS